MSVKLERIGVDSRAICMVTALIHDTHSIGSATGASAPAREGLRTQGKESFGSALFRVNGTLLQQY